MKENNNRKLIPKASASKLSPHISLSLEGPAAARAPQNAAGEVPAGEMFPGLIHHVGRGGCPDAASAENSPRDGGLGMHGHSLINKILQGLIWKHLYKT
jgi:hypothetical protein